MQKIKCHKGRCWDSTKTFFGKIKSNYENKNIVDKIELDILKKELMIGSYAE